jgi:hypothetical protein
MRLAISCTNGGDTGRAWGYVLGNSGECVIKATYRLRQPEVLFERFFSKVCVLRGPVSAEPVTIKERTALYGPERFTCLPESNSYRCPAGQRLNYGGIQRNRTCLYRTPKRCGVCSQKTQCTTGVFRHLAIQMNEAARQRARDLARTPEFANAQRQRKNVEALFAELKNQIGLRRLRLRRLKLFGSSSFWQRLPRTSSA